jgi:hypothetical protein
MFKEKLSILGIAVIAAGLLTAISLTANAVAESRAQGQGMGPGSNSDQTRDRDRDQDRAQAPIYGSQLMTERERQEHRTKMRSFKTEQERETYRLAQHKKMQERARAKGLTLPDAPTQQTPVPAAPTPDQ